MAAFMLKTCECKKRFMILISIYVSMKNTLAHVKDLCFML